MRAFIGVIIMALVTYIPRVVPLVLCNREIESRYVKSFLYYVPYAVLSALTFPGILYATGNEVTAAIATVVAIILAYMEQSLVVVAIVAVVTVYASSFVF